MGSIGIIIPPFLSSCFGCCGITLLEYVCTPMLGQRLCHESFAELVPCDRSQLENRKGSPSCESSCSWSEAEGTECCHVQLRITSDFYISHAVMSNHHCSSFKTFSVLTLVALKKSDGNCLVTVIFHLIYHLMIIMHRTQNA